jgi:hypothetical protein
MTIITNNNGTKTIWVCIAVVPSNLFGIQNKYSSTLYTNDIEYKTHGSSRGRGYEVKLEDADRAVELCGIQLQDPNYFKSLSNSSLVKKYLSL